MEPKGTFGPRLRQERERRQISVTSIASNTKISRSLLEALERDDVTRWPSGIFRRAFVRSYASAIGMNPDDVWKEFSERFPDPNPPIDPAAEAGVRADLSIERHGRSNAAARQNVKTASVEATKVEAGKGERVELVFRISLPRSLANLALRTKWLATRGPAMTRSQN